MSGAILEWNGHETSEKEEDNDLHLHKLTFNCTKDFVMEHAVDELRLTAIRPEAVTFLKSWSAVKTRIPLTARPNFGRISANLIRIAHQRWLWHSGPIHAVRDRWKRKYDRPVDERNAKGNEFRKPIDVDWRIIRIGGGSWLSPFHDPHVQLNVSNRLDDKWPPLRTERVVYPALCRISSFCNCDDPNLATWCSCSRARSFTVGLVYDMGHRFDHSVLNAARQFLLRPQTPSLWCGPIGHFRAWRSAVRFFKTSAIFDCGPPCEVSGRSFTIWLRLFYDLPGGTKGAKHDQNKSQRSHDKLPLLSQIADAKVTASVPVRELANWFNLSPVSQTNGQKGQPNKMTNIEQSNLALLLHSSTLGRIPGILFNYSFVQFRSLTESCIKEKLKDNFESKCKVEKWFLNKWRSEDFNAAPNVVHSS